METTIRSALAGITPAVDTLNNAVGLWTKTTRMTAPGFAMSLLDTRKERVFLEDILEQLSEVYDRLTGRLDSIKSEMRDSYHALLRYQNTFVDVNRLPAEVLLPIFIFATTDNPRYKSCIAGTCSRWRDICKSSLRYWGTFTVPKDLDWRTEHILNTDRCLLYLTVDNLTLSDPTMEGLLSYKHRIRHLSSHNAAIDHKTRKKTARLVETCGNLEVLTVDGGCAHAWEDFVLPANGDSGTRDLSMYSINLVNCRLPYYPGRFRALRRLSIEYDSPPVVRKEYVDGDGELVDLLLACPNLEDLALKHVPMSVYEVVAPPVQIPMYSLHRLSLDMHIERIRSLLASITTSADQLIAANIKLTSMKTWAGCEWNQELLQVPLLPFQHFNPAHSLPTLVQAETLRMSFGKYISSTRVRQPHTPLAEARISFHSADRTCNTMTSAYEQLLSSILNDGCGLTSVLHLHLAHFPFRHSIAVLRAAPRVRELELDSPDAIELLARLAKSHAHTTKPLAPDLQTVTLSRCTLVDETVRVLSHALSQLNLHTLTLRDCEPPPAMTEIDVLQLLRRPGLDIQWDEGE
ncbi:hypothetical protein C8Q76DRAFT_853124 [Earliella scabrosa]|nr:hypothetical protein C8Q76DRAFT_853124 [Earliella scabrosa]